MWSVIGTGTIDDDELRVSYAVRPRRTPYLELSAALVLRNPLPFRLPPSHESASYRPCGRDK